MQDHPPQTTPPWDRFSKLRLDRNSSDSRGLDRRHFSTLRAFPCCPLLNSYFSHLFRPFSVTQGRNLVSTWVKVPHLGTFIVFQYLSFPPLCPSSNFLHFLHSWGFNIYTSPLASLQLLAFVLFQYLHFPSSAPQQLPALMWVHMWHPPGLPAISCKPLASIF